MFTGSVFRKHTKQDEGFLGGGRWKYNIKASELYPKSSNSQEEDDEGKETVGDDATVASKDCAAGLIRMGLLPRIRYLLEVCYFSLPVIHARERFTNLGKNLDSRNTMYLTFRVIFLTCILLCRSRS